ncbi:response regulator transcription factor [Pokkaliibacter sp. CJK22405]|uniref:response regulator transcription factor n=1 Tax=Pokkaliibacter sp. CJK22405 TaxID=3384615 RepID=UPI0039849510
MYRLLLVEDHPRLADMIARRLRDIGIETDWVDTLARARHACRQQRYGAIVMDRGLPDGDGLQQIRQLRSEGDMTPALMMTARDAIHDRIAGLEGGADDYLIKPFEMEELIARVRALLRRPSMIQPLAPRVDDLQLSPENAELSRGELRTPLSHAEVQILFCLMQTPGEVQRRSRLEHAAWGLDAVTPNALDVALHRLRRKLKELGSTREINNIRGQGYALV